MPQAHTKTTPDETKVTKIKATTNGATTARKPSEQALQVVDVTLGAAPRVTEVVRKQVEQLRDSSAREQELKSLQRQVEQLRNPRTRDAQLEVFRKRLDAEVAKAKLEGPKIRRRVAKQVVRRAKRARGRVEPVYEPVFKRVEPVYKKRVEPVYKKRVEPVYKKRVEPTVKRVRERI
jgi:hypothetical protein